MSHEVDPLAFALLAGVIGGPVLAVVLDYFARFGRRV